MDDMIVERKILRKWIKNYLSELGRKGGKSRSDRKRAAGKINAAKATAAHKQKSIERKTAK